MAEPQFTTQELESEEWREVPEFPKYSVSNLGRVRRDAKAKGARANQILRPNTALRYHSVMLYRGGVGFRRYIHFLVAAAFIGPRPEGLTVNHEDGIKSNNRATNLTYKTMQEQMDHASEMDLLPTGKRNGRYTHPERYVRGERHPWSKISDTDAATMRTRYATGKVTQKQLALEYGMSRRGVGHILNGNVRKPS